MGIQQSETRTFLPFQLQSGQVESILIDKNVFYYELELSSGASVLIAIG